MSVTKEDLGGSRVKLSITVPAEDFQKSLEAAYRKKRDKYAVKGFRKGKVPISVLEATYGPKLFFNDALNELLPVSLGFAYLEAEVEAVGPAENLNVQSATRENGVEFTVEVWVRPVVTLGNYEGIDATERVYKVRGEDIDAALNQLREENARFTSVDRPAQMGDTVLIDFVGTIDGVPFDGGSEKGVRVLLGSQTFIAGFEEGIVGMTAGEDRQIPVTFPEGYKPDELSGAEAVFSVHMLEIMQKELPELDDDFAQDVSDANTLEELRAQLGKQLQDQYDQRSESYVEAEIVEKIASAAAFDVPPPMIEQRVKEQVFNLQMGFLQNGASLEDELRLKGRTLQQLADGMAPAAEKHVRRQLVMQALVDSIGEEPFDEEIAERLRPSAERAGKTIDEVKAEMKPEALEDLRTNLKWEDTLRKLREMSNITVIEVDSPQKIEEEGAPQPQADGDAAGDKSGVPEKSAPEAHEEGDAADEHGAEPKEENTTADNSDRDTTEEQN